MGDEYVQSLVSSAFHYGGERGEDNGNPSHGYTVPCAYNEVEWVRRQQTATISAPPHSISL